MSEPDLFTTAEDDAPRFCRECAFRCTALTGPASHYCDLSKKSVTPDAPACDQYVGNGWTA